MRITALQANTVWASPDDNISEIEQLISGNTGSRLYVLPEMWSTGYATVPAGIAEREPVSVNWMINAARKYDAAICGSIAIEYDGKFYNRQYFCKPDGTTFAYDKHHLFEYAGEDRFYERGNEKVVVEHEGIRFRLVTCFDLRFPEWCRCHGDYDVLICVANWPEQRNTAWETLLRARAIENECLVVGANRTGCDAFCKYTGKSAIINAYGETLAKAPDNEQAAITANFDIKAQNEYRRKFPVLNKLDKLNQ